MYASKAASAYTRNLYEADVSCGCHLLVHSVDTVCMMKSCSLYTKEAFFAARKTCRQSTNPSQGDIIKPHISRLRNLRATDYNPHKLIIARCQRSRSTKFRPLLHLKLSIILLDKARQLDEAWSSDSTVDFDAEGCRVGACFPDLRYLTHAGEEAGSSRYAHTLTAILWISRGDDGGIAREENPWATCGIFEARV